MKCITAHSWPKLSCGDGLIKLIYIGLFSAMGEVHENVCLKESFHIFHSKLIEN